MLQTWLVQLAL